MLLLTAPQCPTGACSQFITRRRYDTFAPPIGSRNQCTRCCQPATNRFGPRSTSSAVSTVGAVCVEGVGGSQYGLPSASTFLAAVFVGCRSPGPDVIESFSSAP